MNLAKLRAWWWHRTGLDGSLCDAEPAAVIERAGWARSVGGVGPYLTIFARSGAARAAIDDAVAALEVHELPSARGCTYVLPASDFALGLAVGRDFGGAEMKTAARLGVTEQEVDALGDAVVDALAAGPLDPDAIRQATGSASRSLGEAGKKKGLTTTLPLALGRLQTRGAIRRVPVNGRLDQQRYAYARWTPPPEVPAGDAFTELAGRFFRRHGPATVAEFQWFAGLGVKAAKLAVEPLGLVPAEPGADRLLLPEDAEAYAACQPDDAPRYALVSSLDPIAANRREIVTLLDPADRERVVAVDSGKRPLGGLADLPSHAILDRGRLVGLWEFDPDAGAIVWATFDGRRDAALDAAVSETESFVRDQLGDARSFSLDSPKSRRPRIEALRAM
ncbi:MAG: winged helix DNA-binding domain-containing protein [Gemmatirosa sp.]|nr:winged helix DNA-binding domain-containing protein [Gemmatirosa sp.]